VTPPKSPAQRGVFFVPIPADYYAGSPLCPAGLQAALPATNFLQKSSIILAAKVPEGVDYEFFNIFKQLPALICF
jgi:hypothetical protein